MEETHTFPESKVRAEFINTSVAVDMVKLTKEGQTIVMDAEEALTLALMVLDKKNRSSRNTENIPPISLK